MGKALTLTDETGERGWKRYTFEDRYGEPCSIQKSSLATEDAIWLGTEGRTVQGPPWKEFVPPEDVLVKSRMHLTQDQVRELLPLLQHFVKTGELP